MVSSVGVDGVAQRCRPRPGTWRAVGCSPLPAGTAHALGDGIPVPERANRPRPDRNVPDGVEGSRLKERVPERAQWIVSRIVLVISFASCELLADTLMVAYVVRQPVDGEVGTMMMLPAKTLPPCSVR